MELNCRQGNRYDVRTSLKVLPNKRVTKMFIVCPHDQIEFSVTFHHFTNTSTMKNPLAVSSILRHAIAYALDMEMNCELYRLEQLFSDMIVSKTICDAVK